MNDSYLKRGVAAIVVCAALAIAATAAAPGKGRQSGWPSWRVPLGDVQKGRAIARTCLTCHGENAPAAAGLDPRPPKLSHQRASYMFFALRAYRDGGRKSDIMGPMAQTLSDQDMRDVAAFFEHGMPDRPPDARTAMPGYRITSRECTWCHGETGIGELEGSPVLTGQDPDYIIHALASYRSGERSDPTMRAEVKRITPAEDKAVAAYFAAHKWLERGQ